MTSIVQEMALDLPRVLVYKYLVSGAIVKAMLYDIVRKEHKRPQQTVQILEPIELLVWPSESTHPAAVGRILIYKDAEDPLGTYRGPTGYVQYSTRVNNNNRGERLESLHIHRQGGRCREIIANLRQYIGQVLSSLSRGNMLFSGKRREAWQCWLAAWHHPLSGILEVVDMNTVIRYYKDAIRNATIHTIPPHSRQTATKDLCSKDRVSHVTMGLDLLESGILTLKDFRRAEYDSMELLALRAAYSLWTLLSVPFSDMTVRIGGRRHLHGHLRVHRHLQRARTRNPVVVFPSSAMRGEAWVTLARWFIMSQGDCPTLRCVLKFRGPPNATTVLQWKRAALAHPYVYTACITNTLNHTLCIELEQFPVGSARDLLLNWEPPAGLFTST